MGNRLIAVVAAAAGLSAVEDSFATLKIDLRFADGSKTLNVTPGDLTPININAWAIVSGASGNNNAEGLQSAVLALQSQIISSGISGKISSGLRAPGWGGAGSQGGTSSNISADGVGDWGSTAAASSSLPAAWFRARTTKGTNNPIDWGDADSPSNSTFNTLSSGGVEFLVGKFVFTPTAMPSGASLKYVAATPSSGAISPATWWEDAADKEAGQPNGGHIASTGTFGPALTAGPLARTSAVLPEPSMLGVAGIAGLGLLRRRRRSF